jgi:uncharacterized membrane protein YdbT with pleckstrin-like domain
MIETNKKYYLGRKTFLIILFKSSKFSLLFSILTAYLSYLLYSGFLKEEIEARLNPDFFYITTDMIALWSILLSISFLVLAFVKSIVYYKQYSFTLDNHALKIKKGILLIKEVVVPYHHIQNVEILRSYFLLPFGLVELDIVTNSSSSLDSLKKENKLFPLMDKKLAESLARELIKRGVQVSQNDESQNDNFNNKRRRRRR